MSPTMKPWMEPTNGRRAGACLLVLAAVVFVGCRHTTQFTSTPEGAQVTINGIPRGNTPSFHETRSGFPTTYYVKIELPGYKKIETSIPSSYRADLSLLLLIPGIIPYFFSARLEDTYDFPLVPESGKGD